ncbi:hypothetical protein [Synechococcus sp. H70.2]|uniref:hypothetical protein n=1 Tax=unclassified Synechococcus TaxID=2626047 RepID=UPI0039C470B1
MPRKPDGYLIHIMLEGGQTLQVRVKEAREYTELINQLMVGGDEFIPLPKQMDNEYMIVRPRRVAGVSVEAIYTSSVGIEGV